MALGVGCPSIVLMTHQPAHKTHTSVAAKLKTTAAIGGAVPSVNSCRLLHSTDGYCRDICFGRASQKHVSAASALKETLSEVS